MNNEIKEIYLSNLEWTKTHDDIGGVMGNAIFKDNMSYEEYQKMQGSGYFVLCNKDYITNLQEEIKYQKQAEQEYNEKHTKLMKKYKKIQERIDKAIEYIELWHYRNDYRVNSFTTECKNDLLNILQGEDKEIDQLEK